MTDSDRIAKYAIIRRLGTGGMAEVFKCHFEGIGGFDKVVVVKRILPHLAEDEEFVSMFLDEARIAANLNHPNVVQIYEIDQDDDGRPYIAMEFVKGPTFSQLIRAAFKAGPAPVARMVKIIIGAAMGLDHAHNAAAPDGSPLNIVHRDVSPHNVMVSVDGIPKILDFGVARANGRLTHTRSGAVKGKARFIAPELLKDPDALSPRADVFSLGVCLYAATTGAYPFEGQTENEIMENILRGSFRKPSEVIPTYPADLEDIVLWALCQNPELRCPSCKDLGERLNAWLVSTQQPVTSQDIGKWVRELFPNVDEEAWGADLARTPSNVSSKSLARRPPSPNDWKVPTFPGDPRKVPVRIKLPYTTEAEFIERYGTNVTKETLFIATRVTKPAGTALAFELVLADGSRLMRGEGDVIADDQAGRPGILVRFGRLDSRTQALVERIVITRVGIPTPVLITDPATGGVPSVLAGMAAVAQEEKPALNFEVTVDEPPVVRRRRFIVATAIAAVAALAVVLLWPSKVPTARPYLDEAKRAILAGRLTVAVELVEKARKVPDLPHDEMIEATHLAESLKVAALVEEATTAVARNDVAAATVKLEQVERLWPSSPEVRRLRAQLDSQQPVAVNDPTPPAVDPPPAQPEIDLSPIDAPTKPTVRPGTKQPVSVKPAVTPQPPPTQPEVPTTPTPTPPPPAVLKLSAPVTAQLTIDGRPAGHTPLELATLAPGEHTVSATAEGFEPLVQKVIVAAGETTSVALELKAVVKQPVKAPPPPPEDPQPTGNEAALAALGSCPEDTSAQGTPPPAGLSVWCATADGVKHGRFIRWHKNGQRAEDGAFFNGKKNGQWVEYFEDGTERDRMTWRRGVKTW